MNTEERLEYIYSDEWNSEPYPLKMNYIIRNYQGNLKAQNMGKSIYYTETVVFPKYYKKLRKASEEKIKNYYTRNAEEIKKDFGIEQEEDFCDLIENLQRLQKRKIEFESSQIESLYVQKKDDRVETVLYVKYKNCVEIGFYLRVLNQPDINYSPIQYTAAMD